MSNQLLNKFKTIDLSRRRLKSILENKGIKTNTSSLGGLIENVDELVSKDYTSFEWNGVEIEPMPTDYYVPEIDMDAIYEADTSKDSYANVVLYLLDATNSDFNLIQNAFQSFEKYKFSDSSTLYSPAKNTESPAHTWTTSKDIVGTSGRKYRWVMGYSNTASMNCDINNQNFGLEAIVVYKGSYNTFYYRDTNNTPRYIEIKDKVTALTLTGHSSAPNGQLRTVISNATNANIANNAFYGCRNLYMVYWNSKATNSMSSTFRQCTGLRWLYLKQVGTINEYTFQEMRDCYIQIDTVTGWLFTTTSDTYHQTWPLNNTSNLRIKVGTTVNIGYPNGGLANRDDLYYTVGVNYIDIDLVSGGQIYNGFNCESKQDIYLKIREIHNCTISRYAFRCVKLYPEIKISGATVWNGPDSNGAHNTFELCDTVKKIDMSEAIFERLYNYVFSLCPKLETVILPNAGLKQIGSYIVRHTNIKNIVIPDSVTSIDGAAFRYNPLESVWLGNSLATIPSYLFAGQSKLEEIIIPESVTAINSYAFMDTQKLKSIRIPAGVSVLSERTFMHSGIQSVEMLGKDITIGKECFKNCCNLKSINMENVVQVSDYCLENTNLEHLIIPAGLISISANSLVRTNAKKITFAEGFEPNSNIDISYSNIDDDTVLDLFYSMPDLTGKTARTLTISPTLEMANTGTGYKYYDTIKSKKITANEDGLVWDNSGSMTVAQYVTSKNWAVV